MPRTRVALCCVVGLVILWFVAGLFVAGLARKPKNPTMELPGGMGEIEILDPELQKTIESVERIATEDRGDE